MHRTAQQDDQDEWFLCSWKSNAMLWFGLIRGNIHSLRWHMPSMMMISTVFDESTQLLPISSDAIDCMTNIYFWTEISQKIMHFIFSMAVKRGKSEIVGAFKMFGIFWVCIFFLFLFFFLSFCFEEENLKSIFTYEFFL